MVQYEELLRAWEFDRREDFVQIGGANLDTDASYTVGALGDVSMDNDELSKYVSERQILRAFVIGDCSVDAMVLSMIPLRSSSLPIAFTSSAIDSLQKSIYWSLIPAVSSYIFI